MTFHLLSFQAEGTEVTKTYNWLLCAKGQYGLAQDVLCQGPCDAALNICVCVCVCVCVCALWMLCFF